MVADAKDLTYSQFTDTVKKDEVKSIEFDPSNGDISGTFKAEQGGTKDFTSSGPNNDLSSRRGHC